MIFQLKMISFNFCFCLLLLFCVIISSSSSIHHHHSFIFVSASSDQCTFPSQRVQCGSLTCNTSSGSCIPCTSTSQCFNVALECMPTESTEHSRCELMDFDSLFSKRPAGAIFSIIVGIAVCAIAVVGGVGGGGVLVPMFSILMGLPLLDAVGLSQATIVGQSTFNVFLKCNEFHPHYQPPKPTRPVINYALMAFWLPISLVGTMWGNLLGKVVPDWFRLLMLFLLLTYALKRMVDRMMAQKREDEAKRAEGQSAAVSVATVARKPTGQRRGLLNDDDEDEDEDEHATATASTPKNRFRKSYLTADDSSDENHASSFFDEKQSRVSTKPKAPKHLIKALKEKVGGGNAASQKVDEALIMMGPLPARSDSDFSMKTLNSPTATNNNSSNNTSPNETLQVTVVAEEEQAEQPEQQQQQQPTSQDPPLPTHNAQQQQQQQQQQQKEEQEPDDHPEASPQFPRLQLLLVLATFLPLLIANLIKNRLMECGGAGFWTITFGITIYNLSLSLWYRRHLENINKKISIGEADPELVPFRWNDKTTIWFPIVSAAAGAAASLLGIGGGLILSFLFLEAGLVPEESSATGGFATFAVALESLLQFAIQGTIRIDYFGIFFLAGLCATAIGQLVIMPEIKRRGWRFLIVGSLAFIMASSMLALTIVGVWDTVELISAGGSIGFGKLCHKQLLHHSN